MHIDSWKEVRIKTQLWWKHGKENVTVWKGQGVNPDDRLGVPFLTSTCPLPLGFRFPPYDMRGLISSFHKSPSTPAYSISFQVPC
jgi:hypothetical protein